MRKLIIYGFIALVLVGCAKSPQEKLDEERKKLDIQVQNIVRQTLKDGDSAKFRNSWEFCGEVNAKNSFGAYTGFQRYIVTKEKIYFETEYVNAYPELFDSLWKSNCKH
jgi:hypothetical protein